MRRKIAINIVSLIRIDRNFIEFLDSVESDRTGCKYLYERVFLPLIPRSTSFKLLSGGQPYIRLSPVLKAVFGYDFQTSLKRSDQCWEWAFNPCTFDLKATDSRRPVRKIAGTSSCSSLCISW